MKRELELYLHIPFCVKKCKYCDFISRPASDQERQEYVEYLCQKIRSYRELSKAYEYHVVSIFIGGGTPSILEPVQMSAIFSAVRSTFPVDADAEITIEVNPGTVTKLKLLAYERLGINRLSIGLQSVDNAELRMLGRIHKYEDFLETYEMARALHFDNINVDLMSGIPFQTVEKWKETLIKTAKLNPEHISAYSLIIEEGTPFFDKYGNGKRARELPSEEEERMMYACTKAILEEYGYRRYEISNYAKMGRECRHNLGYWDRAEYLGIGTGAASLLQNYRITEGEDPVELSLKEQMEEFMFLGLRKIAGVSKEKFFRDFGESMDTVYGEVIKKLCSDGLLEEDGDKVRLTERGIDISNYVMSEFIQ